MANHDKKSDIIDLGAILKNYRKHWWWFLISVIVCGIGAYVYVKTHPREFAIRANVLVADDDTSSFTSMSGMGELFGSTAYVEDELFVINSHTLLRDVARNLGVNKTHLVRRGFLSKNLTYPNFPIDVYPAPGIEDTLTYTLTFDVDVDKKGIADIVVKDSHGKIAKVKDTKLPASVKTPYGLFVVDRTKYAPKDEKISSLVYVSGFDGAAEDLAEMIFSEKASKKSRMIEMTLRTSNVNYGTAILDEIIEMYNKRAVEEKRLQGEKTARFIDERLALISGDLEDAESNIQNYKQQHAITDVTAEAGYNMTRRGVAESALTTAETRSELIKMTRDFINNPKNAFEMLPITDEMGSATGSIRDYNEMLMSRMTLLNTAKPGNRALKILDDKIEAMRATINESLNREYQNSQLGVREARKAADKALGGLSQVPEQEREFLGLKRQQEVKQRLYMFLLQRREETQIALANALPKGRVVDQAFAFSQPVSMGKFKILAIAMVIALLIPCFVLYVLQMFKTKFDTSHDFQKISDIPLLGEICLNKSGKNLVALPGDASSVSELFRALRSNLNFVLGGGGSKVVLVTSTRSGEGKSFVAVNLAATFAQQGKRTLIVGMDVRKPRLAEYLGLSNTRGLTNLIVDPELKITSLLQHINGVPGLEVLVAGPVPPNPAELLSSTNLDDIFAYLRENYDVIVIDSAPVGMVADTFNISRLADVTVYVTRANYTTRSDVKFANGLYDNKRLPSMSVVVNGTHASSGYGYGYHAKK